MSEEDDPDPEEAREILEWIKGARLGVGLLHFEKTDEGIVALQDVPRIIT